MPHAEAKRLQLWPMVSENDAPLATAFTVSVDVRKDLTTGISAKDRANTVRALADPKAVPDDFVRPGHIFPLIAKDGGVLIRTGHTEAAVDLSRLAGLSPVSLISELVNDDGSVQQGEQLQDFAKTHSLKLISIDDLIAWRQSRETLVERVSDNMVETEIGSARAVVYETRFDDAQHIALIFGDLGEGNGILTRFQREDTVTDIFNAPAGAITASLKRIRAEGRGVVVYLRQGATGVVAQGGAVGTDNAGAGAESDAARRAQWREVGLGAQILADLGIRSIRLLSTTERQYVGLSGFDLVIQGTEII
jgi:3,4-dihydroxy 2-butanone 4-phosphate synthase/GTP cyclohydrolase II